MVSSSARRLGSGWSRRMGEISSNAASYFAAGLKGRANEDKFAEHTGLNQVYAFASYLITELRMAKGEFNPREFHAEGIADMGDHYVIVIPAPILAKPATTVGLGDVVSSAALTAEL